MSQWTQKETTRVLRERRASVERSILPVGTGRLGEKVKNSRDRLVTTLTSVVLYPLEAGMGGPEPVSPPFLGHRNNLVNPPSPLVSVLLIPTHKTDFLYT